MSPLHQPTWLNEDMPFYSKQQETIAVKTYWQVSAMSPQQGQNWAVWNAGQKSVQDKCRGKAAAYQETK